MKRHEADFVSLAFGIVFMVVGVVFVSGRVEVDDLAAVWGTPALFLATGLVLGALALNRHRRGRPDPPDRPGEGPISAGPP